MDTDKGNILIAEFMGFEPHTDNKGDNDDSWISSGGWFIFYVDDFRYRTCWDELMPIVNKIFDVEPWDGMDDDFDEMKQDFIDEVSEHLGEIEGYWQACVKFIEWYNNIKPEGV
jgi:hypothetical protein